ncbi:MAG TPA: hypothetical protein VF170_04225, partial [Planctomycetaceae bacterium]
LLDDGVFLFDPALGLPVPAPDAPRPEGDSVLPRPATWAQAVENPDLLVAYRREAGLEADPIPADRLRNARVELMGPSSFWMTAMGRLELSMTGDRGVLLYDPLHDTEAGPGLYSRVVQAGSSVWTAEAISVWPYAEEVRTARASLDEPQPRLGQRIQPYLGPVEPHPKTGVLGRYRKLWETRVEHMSGRPGSAIGTYLQVRLANQPDPNLSPADLSLNALAADEAFYWSAHAQYGSDQYDAAVETVDEYLGQGGDRSEEAAALRALALAAQGRTADAAAAVAELPETTPGLDRLRWLARWWTASPTEQAAAAE